MRDALGPGTILGYCTNVHAGTTPGDIEANLERHALAIKQRVAPREPMGVGLWLPAAAARSLRAGGRAQAFGDWLGERGLLPFTLNGFPYGDFHRPVVKHAVYRPDWTTSERLAYTIDLMHVLADLLAAVGPEAGEGSISTLPLGWPTDLDAPGRAEEAALNLRRAAREAAPSGPERRQCMCSSATVAIRRAPILGATAWIQNIRAAGKVEFGAYKKDPG